MYNCYNMVGGINRAPHSYSNLSVLFVSSVHRHCRFDGRKGLQSVDIQKYMERKT